MELTAKESDALIKIHEFEKDLTENDFRSDETEYGKFGLGWSWRDVAVHPGVLNNLVIKGCLITVYNSRSYTGYRLTDEGKELAKLSRLEVSQGQYDLQLEVPDDLFDVIEGYGDIKDLFLTSLLGEPVDFLMVGVPGSAKTMFLSELERVGGATPTVLGGTASKVGLMDILFDYRPRLLLMDEFEHMDTKDYTVLLSLCETRIISETKHGKHRRIELPNTRVFAGCNTTRTLPGPVLDRMQVVRFGSYNRKEFEQVVVNVLSFRMGMDVNLSEYIASKTWEGLNHSVRQAIRIAKMAKNKEEVDKLLEVMGKYSVNY